MDNGSTRLLIFNQVLYFGDRLEHSLICPNQLRSNGVIVNDIPTHLDPNPNKDSHQILVKDSYISIPLEMNGFISFFEGRIPTDEEILTCERITMTSPEKWEPYDTKFKD